MIHIVAPQGMGAGSDAPENSTEHTITLRDCNSITEAHISLRQSCLNIKYGPNGIGKSTIARALTLNAEGGEGLQDLLPFKYRQEGESKRPSVVGADHIKSVLVFDENYVSQFAFCPNEVIKNSFEIFIDTPEYRGGIAEIESIFESLKAMFTENDALDATIASFTELRDAFSLTKAGSIAKTSRGYRALSMGGKLASIPVQLRGYESFLRSEDPAGWITWQSKGKAYLGMSGNCPFCSAPDFDKDTALKVSEEYESAAVRTISALRAVIERLERFFEPKSLAKLKEITTKIGELSLDEGGFLANLRGQVETLLSKFVALKDLSFHALRDVPDVELKLRELKIDLSLLEALDSEGIRPVVTSMNDRLDEVADQIGTVKARIGVQKSRVEKSIRDNQDQINEFLKSAGYQYAVRIEPSGDSYRMILEHKDCGGHLEAAARHLSFGERNAFALVLFMHHVRHASPDLVVLDDPVSSFDKTKKFAILHKLFHGKTSLRDSTTLLLTHDIEPVVDIVRTATSGQFAAARPMAHFLRSRGGNVEEKQILPTKIMTFSQICDANIASSADEVIKCIYLRRRYEVHGDTGAEYDVLSSLLHLRTAPTQKDPNGRQVALSDEAVSAAAASIRTSLPDFDYRAILAQLQDLAALIVKFEATDVGYEKVQLFRIARNLIPGASIGSASFQKFVNESYHIENEYVMQLNPREFDSVPEYVVHECARLLRQ